MGLSWNEVRARAAAFAEEWKGAAHENGEKQSICNPGRLGSCSRCSQTRRLGSKVYTDEHGPRLIHRIAKRGCAMSRITVALLAFTLLNSYATKGEAQVSDNELFQFCSVIPYISVEVFVQETGDFRILSEERIRMTAERPLLRFGLLAEKGLVRLMPSLRVSVIKHHEAYSGSVIFKKWLRGVHPEAWFPVAVWNTSWVGTASRDVGILEAVEQGVKVFLSNYLGTQSSHECDDWKATIASQFK